MSENLNTCAVDDDEQPADPESQYPIEEFYDED